MSAPAYPRRKQAPAAPRYALAPVHYAAAGPGTPPACLPHDPPQASRHRKGTADPAAADCWQCRETPSWQAADLFAGLDAYRVRGGR